MADPIVDTSPLLPVIESTPMEAPLVETITPTPELEAVCPDCEILSPEPELEKIPSPGEMAPPAIGSGATVEETPAPEEIGSGVYPTLEETDEVKEENSAEEKEEEEEQQQENEENNSEDKEEEPKEEEEQKEQEGTEEEITEEELIPEETIDEPALPAEEQNDFWDFLKIPEVAAMVTLAESAFSAACRQLEPLTTRMYDQKNYPLADKVFSKLEQLTGAKRENLTYGTMTFLIVYFFIGNLVQITCNLVGFVYPAWRSIKAVRSASKDDDTQWLIYWVCFAFFSVLDLSMFSTIPFYWMGKVVFLLYLYLPHFKGANHIYETYIDPGCTLIESYFTAKEDKEKKN